MPQACGHCEGKGVYDSEFFDLTHHVCEMCGGSGQLPTPMEVLRKIMDGHKKCKNECSLLGELENWMRAYEGKSLQHLKEGEIRGA